MNEVSKIEPLHLNFVIPAFQKEFENQVVDTYMRYNGKGLPTVLENILLHLTRDKPEYFLSALLGQKHLNERYLFDIIEKMSKRERFLFLHGELNKYEMKKASGDHSDGLYENLLYQDIMTVLNYKNMSYLDGFLKRYINIPVGKVW
jgi:hypothetical protein